MAQIDSVLSAHLGIAARSTEEKVLRLLIELGAQVIGAEDGSLLVLDEGGKHLVFAMTVKDDEAARAMLGQRVPVGKGITGLAAQTHEVQIGHPTFSGVQQSREPTMVMAAPMLIDDNLVGVITAITFNPQKRFTADNAKLYGRLAAIAGVVIEQHRRLAAHETLRSGTALHAPHTEQERRERILAAAVGKLAASHPEKLESIARLIGAITEICPP